MRINVFYLIILLTLIVLAEGVYIVLKPKVVDQGSATPPVSISNTTAGVVSNTAPAPAITPAPPPLKLLPKINGPFSVGMKGEEVKKLQQMLAQDKNIYPEGVIDGYYGPETVEAVKRFQNKYKIITSGEPNATGFGLAGPGTRAKLNALYAGGDGTIVITTPTAPPAFSTGSVASKPVVISPTADITSPTMPTNLSFSVVSDTQVNLVWITSTDFVSPHGRVTSGVAGYRVYRNGVEVGTTPSQRYANINLTPETIYTFAVAAYDKAGNISAKTFPVMARTPAHQGGATGVAPEPSGLPSSDKTAPSTPTGLIGMAISVSQIDLAWTISSDNVSVIGYRVFRNGVKIASIVGATYSDTGLATSTIYFYTVAAYDSAGNQSLPARISVATQDPPLPDATSPQPSPTLTPPPTPTPSPTPSPSPTPTPSPTPSPSPTPPPSTPDTTAPSVPTGLTATAVSSSQINLTWTASTDNVGVTGYRIYRGGTQIATATTNSYSNTGRTANTSYTYTVAAYDAAGNVSAQSTSASATTLSPGQTYTVTVTNNGVISPASLTIHVGDTVNFVYGTPRTAEIELVFSPKPPNNIIVDSENTQRSYTFTTVGTYTYHELVVNVTQATIIVQ